MHITHIETVRLCNEETLAERITYWRTTWTRGAVMDDLWREIRFVLTADGIKLSLGSHNAHGGYRAGVLNRFLTWNDLDDVEGLHNLLAHEQFVVAQKALGMLAELRGGRLAMRKTLSMDFGQSTKKTATFA